MKSLNSVKKKSSILVIYAFLCLTVAGSADGAVQDEKLTAAQVVQNHLESIGPAEKRSGIKSITAVGEATALFKGRGEGRAEGIAVLASQAEKNMVGMKFNNSDYAFEKFGFDGKDFNPGFVRPGEYTVLGQFMRVNAKTFKVGILGGVMSTAWEIADPELGGGKLRAKGKTKIDGNDVLKFGYSPKGGSDLDVTLFFDAKSFRHLRTEYSRVISAAQGLTVDTSSRQSETRYKMIEDFGDFRVADGLNLPHSYKLYLEIFTGNGTTSQTWNIGVQKYTFNHELADSEFQIN